MCYYKKIESVRLYIAIKCLEKTLLVTKEKNTFGIKIILNNISWKLI